MIIELDRLLFNKDPLTTTAYNKIAKMVGTKKTRGTSRFNKLLLKEDFYTTNFLIYAKGKEILGCIGIKKFTNNAEIKALYVKPEHRKKGVASLLLSAILKYKYFLYATIHPYNNSCVKLFEKFGFKITNLNNILIAMRDNVIRGKVFSESHFPFRPIFQISSSE